MQVSLWVIDSRTAQLRAETANEVLFGFQEALLLKDITEKNASTIDKEGWLHSGDKAHQECKHGIGSDSRI